MTARSAEKAPTGWVVVTTAGRHPRYFIAAIADPHEAIASVRRLLGESGGVLKLGSQLNAIQLGARAMKTGDVYQLGKQRTR